MCRRRFCTHLLRPHLQVLDVHIRVHAIVNQLVLRRGRVVAKSAGGAGGGVGEGSRNFKGVSPPPPAWGNWEAFWCVFCFFRFREEKCVRHVTAIIRPQSFLFFVVRDGLFCRPRAFGTNGQKKRDNRTAAWGRMNTTVMEVKQNARGCGQRCLRWLGWKWSFGCSCCSSWCFLDKRPWVKIEAVQHFQHSGRALASFLGANSEGISTTPPPCEARRQRE